MNAVTASESAEILASELLACFDSETALTDIAHLIDNLTETSATELISALVERGGNRDFCIGGVLEAMNDMGWYGGFESLSEYVRATCDFDIRQAQHLMRTYRYLMHKGINWNTVKDLGWTKLRLLVNADKLTAENAAEWVAKAAGKAMTVRALENELKFVHVPPAPSPAPVGAPTSAAAASTAQQAAAAAITAAATSSKASIVPALQLISLGGTDGDEGVETMPAQEPDTDDEPDAEYEQPEQHEDNQPAVGYSPEVLEMQMRYAGPDTVLAMVAKVFPGVVVPLLH